ncbi:MAG: M24 family metallopeptidase, partial [Methanothrix sp.]|nr:M24 family metallopeptidase [Methanothrix sp.]
DWGAEIDGYRSDLTRTIVLGEPDAKFREVYGIVLQAQLNAIANIKAGQSWAEKNLERDSSASPGRLRTRYLRMMRGVFSPGIIPLPSCILKWTITAEALLRL